ncbi:MAG: hypothetical protein HYT11_02560 [Candidatus Levybacteria bacterium]|nr:hypothetical protein [Candidatus Levybacteria bacterium]
MKAFKTTWNHIRRSPYQAIAAIIVATQSFFIITLLTFVVIGSAKVIQYFESRPQVMAFFKDEADQKDIDVLHAELDRTGKVAKLRFISKKEALQIYRKQNADNPLLLDLVTEDILPASFEISAVQIEQLSDIAGILKKSPLVQTIFFPEDVVAVLSSFTSAVSKIGAVLIVFFMISSMFIIAIIISIKISQKKEEIEVMRLLSATNWYIRWPFIFEGIVYGIVGAVVGWLLASLILLYITPSLKSILLGIPLLPVPLTYLFALLGIELVIAVVLGVVSSFLAVFRYLR